MEKINGREVIEFLNSKWKGTGCPMCSGKEWIVSEKAFELREFQDGNLVLGGESAITVVIPVTCKNCGNTVFINAIASGLMRE